MGWSKVGFLSGRPLVDPLYLRSARQLPKLPALTGQRFVAPLIVSDRKATGAHRERPQHLYRATGANRGDRKLVGGGASPQVHITRERPSGLSLSWVVIPGVLLGVYVGSGTNTRGTNPVNTGVLASSRSPEGCVARPVANTPRAKTPVNTGVFAGVLAIVLPTHRQHTQGETRAYGRVGGP